MQNFSRIGQKIKDLKFLPQTIAKMLDDVIQHVIVITSSEFLMPLRDFVLQYHSAMFAGDWTIVKSIPNGHMHSLTFGRVNARVHEKVLVLF